MGESMVIERRERKMLELGKGADNEKHRNNFISYRKMSSEKIIETQDNYL